MVLTEQTCCASPMPGSHTLNAGSEREIHEVSRRSLVSRAQADEVCRIGYVTLVSYGAENGDATYAVDELRLGTTFQSVTPTE
jgi:hypothetical protein